MMQIGHMDLGRLSVNLQGMGGRVVNESVFSQANYG